MENKKFYTREKEVNGVKYIAQFNGLTAALEAIDRCYVSDQSSNISTAKLTKYIFNNVIVEPKNLTPDDFDSVEELNEVVAWARDVMQGKFRDAQNGSGANKKSKGE